MGVTYIVGGVEVDPNGQPINKGDQAPHSWIPVIRDGDLDPSAGEIAAAAARTAPNPMDFDTEEDYRVAVQENEAQVAQELLAQRRMREGRDPETGEVLIQQPLPESDEPAGTSEDPGGKSEKQAATSTIQPAVVPAPTTPTNAGPPGETAAEKKKREAEEAKNRES